MVKSLFLEINFSLIMFREDRGRKMFCYNCGSGINEQSKFCQNCGSKVNVQESVDNENSNLKVKNLEYREPLFKSIVYGFTFIQNCIANLLGGLGYRYRKYGYAMSWILCILLAPTWILVSIAIIMFRIFVMPILKGNNII